MTEMRLHCIDYDFGTMEWLAGCGDAFAHSKPHGSPGMRGGTIYSVSDDSSTRQGGRSCIAYWTRKRAVVVRELI